MMSRRILQEKQRSASLYQYSLVAADAFVPSSFTSILAFWRAFDTYTGSAPEKMNLEFGASQESHGNESIKRSFYHMMALER